MKGIVLAGGAGSRLHPVTLGVSKQLLPVFDKPMVFYPLSLLMLAGIRDVLLICAPEHQDSFSRLLGDGSDYGINISYAIQEEPRGLADAFLIGENFIGQDNVCLVLGDNIFWGQELGKILRNAARSTGATLFAQRVKDPSQFGVVEFDDQMRIISIQEKPAKPKSDYAVTGLYFYGNEVVELAKKVVPSARNELEITSINQHYLRTKQLDVKLLGRGFAWLDAGTHDSLLAASNFIETIETRQGVKVACLEEIALSNGWISKDQIASRIKYLAKTSYVKYLGELIN